ncbi:hypothetical protein HID58_014559, partial [Brassica napus]
MGHMQKSVQQISRSQAVARQNSKKCAKHLDVQENLHGVSLEVIDVEGDPTDGARKDKSTASTNKIASNEKCYVPKTLTRKGHKERKKSVPPQAHASKTRSSRRDESREQEQNSLAIYRGDGAVVPYEIKRGKPKNGDEEMNKSKEKPWEVERNVFRGRVDSFMPACILCKEIDVFLHGRDQWLIQSSEFSLHRMSQITF